MIRKAPSFWYPAKADSGFTAAARHIALYPFSMLYHAGHAIHQQLGRAEKIDIPVVCIGNLVAGGSGKTPTAIAVMDLIIQSGLAQNPCFLSRGYGGTLSGPVLVDPAIHSAADTGDEPLLLAQKAPAIIASSRLDGARFARQAGYDFIIMDDGLQNPSLHKDFRLIVVDGASGFGNERLFPAGPLRTPLKTGLAQGDTILLIGEDRQNIMRHVPAAMPVLRAVLRPSPPSVAAQRYVAFCGIAHPSKFRASLHESGVTIAAFFPYPDHYPYTAKDLDHLLAEAEKHGAQLITTCKDYVRLPARFQNPQSFATLPVSLAWTDKDGEALCQMLIKN